MRDREDVGSKRDYSYAQPGMRQVEGWFSSMARPMLQFCNPYPLQGRRTSINHAILDEKLFSPDKVDQRQPKSLCESATGGTLVQRFSLALQELELLEHVAASNQDSGRLT